MYTILLSASLQAVSRVYGYINIYGVSLFRFDVDVTKIALLTIGVLLFDLSLVVLFKLIGACLSFFWSLFLSVFLTIPTMVFSVFSSGSLLVYLLSIAAQYSLVAGVVLFSRTKLPRFKHAISYRVFEKVFYSLTFFLMAYLIATAGLPNLMNFLDVADVRSIRGSTIYTGMFAYLVGIVTEMILPLLFVSSLIRGRRLKALASPLLMILVSMYNAQRGLLLTAVVLVFFFLFYSVLKKVSMRTIIFLLLFVCILMVGTGAVFIVFQNNTVLFSMSYLYFVRSFIVPAQATNFWIDYFSMNKEPFRGIADLGPLRLLSNARHYPTFFNYQFGIGNANTGILAEGYSRGGVFFLILEFLIVGAIFAYLDKFLAIKQPSLRIIATIVVTSLVNIELFTVLLSKGLLLLILFVSLCTSSSFHQTPSDSSVVFGGNG